MSPVVTLCKTVNHHLAPSTWPRCPGTSHTLDRQILRLGTSQLGWQGSSSRCNRRCTSQADIQPSAPDTEGSQQTLSETAAAVPAAPQSDTQKLVHEPVRASSSATAQLSQKALDEEWNPAADWAEEWAVPDVVVPTLRDRASGEE